MSDSYTTIGVPNPHPTTIGVHNPHLNETLCLSSIHHKFKKRHFQYQFMDFTGMKYIKSTKESPAHLRGLKTNSSHSGGTARPNLHQVVEDASQSHVDDSRRPVPEFIPIPVPPPEPKFVNSPSDDDPSFFLSPPPPKHFFRYFVGENRNPQLPSDHFEIVHPHPERRFKVTVPTSPPTYHEVLISPSGLYVNGYMGNEDPYLAQFFDGLNACRPMTLPDYCEDTREIDFIDEYDFYHLIRPLFQPEYREFSSKLVMIRGPIQDVHFPHGDHWHSSNFLTFPNTGKAYALTRVWLEREYRKSKLYPIIGFSPYDDWARSENLGIINRYEKVYGIHWTDFSKVVTELCRLQPYCSDTYYTSIFKNHQFIPVGHGRVKARPKTRLPKYKGRDPKLMRRKKVLNTARDIEDALHTGSAMPQKAAEELFEFIGNVQEFIRQALPSERANLPRYISRMYAKNALDDQHLNEWLEKYPTLTLDLKYHADTHYPRDRELCPQCYMFTYHYAKGQPDLSLQDFQLFKIMNPQLKFKRNVRLAYYDVLQAVSMDHISFSRQKEVSPVPHVVRRTCFLFRYLVSHQDVWNVNSTGILDSLSQMFTSAFDILKNSLLKLVSKIPRKVWEILVEVLGAIVFYYVVRWLKRTMPGIAVFLLTSLVSGALVVSGVNITKNILGLDTSYNLQMSRLQAKADDYFKSRNLPTRKFEDVADFNATFTNLEGDVFVVNDDDRAPRPPLENEHRPILDLLSSVTGSKLGTVHGSATFLRDAKSIKDTLAGCVEWIVGEYYYYVLGEEYLSLETKSVLIYTTDFIAKHKELMLDPHLRSNAIKSKSIRDNLKTILDIGFKATQELLKAKVTPRYLADFQLRYNSLVILYADIQSYVKSTDNRTQPTGVFIYGGSGVGKSTFVKYLFKYCFLYHYAEKYGIKIEEWNANMIYVFDTGSEFADGYINQLFAWIDDIFQDKTPEKLMRECMEVVRVVNIAPYVMNMARLEAKGNTICDAQLLVATSNCTGVPGTVPLQDPDAVRRRFHVKAQMLRDRSTNELTFRLVHPLTDAFIREVDRDTFCEYVIAQIKNNEAKGTFESVKITRKLDANISDLPLGDPMRPDGPTTSSATGRVGLSSTTSFVTLHKELEIIKESQANFEHFIDRLEEDGEWDDHAFKRIVFPPAINYEIIMAKNKYNYFENRSKIRTQWLTRAKEISILLDIKPVNIFKWIKRKWHTWNDTPLAQDQKLLETYMEDYDSIKQIKSGRFLVNNQALEYEDFRQFILSWSPSDPKCKISHLCDFIVWYTRYLPNRMSPDLQLALDLASAGKENPLIHLIILEEISYLDNAPSIITKSISDIAVQNPDAFEPRHKRWVSSLRRALSSSGQYLMSSLQGIADIFSSIVTSAKIISVVGLLASTAFIVTSMITVIKTIGSLVAPNVEPPKIKNTSLKESEKVNPHESDHRVKRILDALESRANLHVKKGGKLYDQQGNAMGHKQKHRKGGHVGYDLPSRNDNYVKYRGAEDGLNNIIKNMYRLVIKYKGPDGIPHHTSGNVVFLKGRTFITASHVIACAMSEENTDQVFEMHQHKEKLLVFKGSEVVIDDWVDRSNTDIAVVRVKHSVPLHKDITKKIPTAAQYNQLLSTVRDVIPEVFRTAFFTDGTLRVAESANAFVDTYRDPLIADTEVCAIKMVGSTFEGASGGGVFCTAPTMAANPFIAITTASSVYSTYAIPITREHIEISLSYLEETAADISPDIKPTSVTDTNIRHSQPWAIVNPDVAGMLPRKNPWVKSPLYEDVQLAHPDCPIVEPNVTWREGDEEPLRTTLENFESELVPTPHELLEPLIDDMHHSYPKNLYYFEMSFDEAVNGIIDKGIPALCKKSSLGFPLKHVIKDKKTIFEDPEAMKLVRQEVDHILDRMQRRKIPLHVSIASLKIEKRPPEKKFKPRMFYVANYAFIIAHRMKLGWLFEMVKKDPLSWEPKVGINPHSVQWDEYMKQLLRFEKIIDGDYSKYDVKLQYGLAKIVYDTFKQYVKTYVKVTPEQLDEINLWLDWSLENHFSGLVLLMRRVVRFIRGLTSGGPITSVIGSDVNAAICRSFAVLNCPDYSELFWRKNAVAGFQSDDHNISISDEFAKFWTKKSFAKFLLDYYGMIYTSADKSDVGDDYSTIQTTTFLKRSFSVRREKGKVSTFAPLPLDVIMTMIMWVSDKSKAYTLARDVAEQALIELQHHPVEVREKETNLILSTAAKFGIKPEIHTLRNAMYFEPHQDGSSANFQF